MKTVNTLVTSMINLSDVVIDYTEVIPESKQMPEFYACGGTKDYAHITKGHREVFVAVNGEMSLVIPTLTLEGALSDEDPVIIRYGDELEELFSDDIQFMQFIKTISNSGFEVYRMNPWWEVFSHNSDMGEVYDTFYEAIDGGIDYILDDRNWYCRKTLIDLLDIP